MFSKYFNNTKYFLQNYTSWQKVLHIYKKTIFLLQRQDNMQFNILLKYICCNKISWHSTSVDSSHIHAFDKLLFYSAFDTKVKVYFIYLYSSSIKIISIWHLYNFSLQYQLVPILQLLFQNVDKCCMTSQIILNENNKQTKHIQHKNKI